jgi:hypothetical protein
MGGGSGDLAYGGGGGFGAAGGGGGYQQPPQQHQQQQHQQQQQQLQQQLLLAQQQQQQQSQQAQGGSASAASSSSAAATYTHRGLVRAQLQQQAALLGHRDRYPIRPGPAFVFPCTDETLDECLGRGLFHLPAGGALEAAAREAVVPGATLFLASVGGPEGGLALHGVFEAVGAVGFNLERTSCSTLFPLQVRCGERAGAAFGGAGTYTGTLAHTHTHSYV